MDDNNLLEAPKLPDGYRFKVIGTDERRLVEVILQRKSKFLFFHVWENVRSDTAFAFPKTVKWAMKALIDGHLDSLNEKKSSAALQGLYPPKRYIGKE